MYDEEQDERFTTVNICINCVVAWLSKQGHRPTAKGHRNLPIADIVEEG